MGASGDSVGAAEIRCGWAPGLLGWAVGAQARHYAEHWGFGAAFEAKLAAEAGAFLARRAPPGAEIFWAANEGGFLATLTVDSGEPREGMAHLRWVFAEARARGRGLGRRLLARGIGAAREAGAAGLWLETFAGLDAARRLYEAAGFRLAHAAEGEGWGSRVVEQRFELRF